MNRRAFTCLSFFCPDVEAALNLFHLSPSDPRIIYTPVPPVKVVSLGDPALSEILSQYDDEEPPEEDPDTVNYLADHGYL